MNTCSEQAEQLFGAVVNTGGSTPVGGSPLFAAVQPAFRRPGVGLQADGNQVKQEKQMTEPTDPRALIEAATPLPWRVDRAPDGHTYGSIVAECAGSFVWAKGNGNDFGDEEISALIGSRDAALIVHAVNRLPRYLDVAEALERLMEHFDGPTLMGSCQTCWLPADEPNDQCREHVAREALARLKETTDA